MIDSLSIGISEDEFWHLNPHKINLRIKAFNKMQERKDEEMWTFGIYIMNAVSTVIANCFGNKAEYMKEPLHKQAITKELTQEEKNRQIEMLFANLQIMQANFEVSHKSNGGTDNGN